MKSRVMTAPGVDALVGDGPAAVALRQDVERVAPTDSKVLITGETGVGKELVARLIHQLSHRAAGPFAAVNCSSLPEALLESELFGHVKGSVAGVYRNRPGRLAAADGGSVFLDEIGEMTLGSQGALLRFLETGELQKLGTDHAERVDVRVMVATNRKLPELVEQGRFRADLFDRLNVIHLEVPALRDRREDIPALVEHFRQRGPHDTVARALSPKALEALVAYRWPGNVRELENVVTRLFVTGRQPVIGWEDLPPEIRSGPDPRPAHERRRTVADELYRRLIERGESFWTTVYPLYMRREITRGQLRELVKKGLDEARGNYRTVTRLFNMQPGEYKRFLNFLRKHACQLPFKDYR